MRVILIIWDKDKRQRHILSIFYTLDVAGAGDIIYKFNDVISVYLANAARSNNTAFVVYVIDSAANAADAADTLYDIEIDKTLIDIACVYGTLYDIEIVNAVTDAACAAAYAADAVPVNIQLNVRKELLHFLRFLKDNENNYPNISIADYGDIWNKFQNALEKEGCSYWGKLYQNLFEQNFVMDKKRLEQRLNVPVSILDQGAAVTGRYLQELEEKGGKRLDEARIIILGDKGVGRTCIARRLVDPEAPMTSNEESTDGVDTLFWNPPGRDLSVRIWDFAGHVVTHAVHKFFLSERCVYIIVYNGRTEMSNRLEYWLNHMKNYGGDSRAFILINKLDSQRVEIPENTLKEKYAIEKVYYFSIKDDRNEMEKFRKEIAGFISENPVWNRHIIPATYYKVKNELEHLFQKEKGKTCKEFIPRNEIDFIAQKYGIYESEQLLSSLHALGVTLWYRNMEKYDTMVLNPEWISHGVYTLINWANKHRKHELSLEDFPRVFSHGLECGRYPEEKYPFLFELMKHYQLAYETKHGTLVIPHLLNDDRPEIFPIFLLEKVSCCAINRICRFRRTLSPCLL